MSKIPGSVGKPGSARRGILDYLLAHVGKTVEGDSLRRAGGNISEWARRVRELRDEFGYQILTKADRNELTQSQYILMSAQPNKGYIFKRGISKETRAFVLERNGYTCQMCGVAAGDPDPLRPNRKVRLTMGHIIDKSMHGKDEPNNLRAVCTNCNEGLQNTAPPKPKYLELMRTLRRATVDDQLKALEWLKSKYSKSGDSSK